MKLEKTALFIASLAIAVLLWYQAIVDVDPSREREVQVKLIQQDLPEGLVVLQAPESVAVLARGPRDMLDNLSAEDLTAAIELKGAKAGAGSYLVRASGGPPGLDLKVLRPRLELEVDRLIEEDRAVAIETSGVPDSRFQYVSSVVQPERVTVRAPAGAMARVSRVVAVLDLRSVEPSAAFMVSVQAVDEEGKPVPQAVCEPQEVEISPVVQAADAARSLFINPDWIGQPAPGFRVRSYTVEPLMARITGPSEALARLSTIQTTPVDLSGLKESKEFVVELRTPNGMQNVSSGQVKVKVVIERAVGS